MRILHDLIDSKKPLDLILIETTGMADPGPVVQTFYMDEKVQAAFRMDSIITMVDAKHANMQLDQTPEAYQQIAFADVLLLNKVDLVQRAERDKLIKRIKEINDVDIVPCEYGRVDLDKIINIGGFNLERVLEREPAFLKEDDDHHHEHVCTKVWVLLDQWHYWLTQGYYRNDMRVASHPLVSVNQAHWTLIIWIGGSKVC